MQLVGFTIGFQRYVRPSAVWGGKWINNERIVICVLCCVVYCICTLLATWNNTDDGQEFSILQNVQTDSGAHPTVWGPPDHTPVISIGGCIRGPERKADHTCPSNAGVKNAWSFDSTT